MPLVIGPQIRRLLAKPMPMVLFTAFIVCSLTLGGSTISYAATNPTSQQMNPLLVVRAGESNDNYILWSKPCGSSQCFRLERSNIADATTTFVTAPPLSKVPRIPMGSLEQLDFANPQDGYAMTNPGFGKTTQLYATFDGGLSWHHETFVAGETVNSINSTPSTFYIVGGVKCSPPDENCQRWQLSSSPSSVSHWTTDSRPYDFGHGSNNPVFTAFGTDVWGTTQEQARPYRTLLARSTDGGRTFKVSSIPNLPSVNGCGLTATSVSSIWAQCDDGNMAGDIEYSNDGGAHWRSLEKVTLGGFFAFGIFDPVSDNLAFFVNGDYSRDFCQLVNRANKSVVVGKPPYPQLASLDFTNSSEGFALGPPLGSANRQVLYETKNGGVSWKRVLG